MANARQNHLTEQTEEDEIEQLRLEALNSRKAISNIPQQNVDSPMVNHYMPLIHSNNAILPIARPYHINRPYHSQPPRPRYMGQYQNPIQIPRFNTSNQYNGMPGPFYQGPGPMQPMHHSGNPYFNQPIAAPHLNPVFMPHQVPTPVLAPVQAIFDDSVKPVENNTLRLSPRSESFVSENMNVLEGRRERPLSRPRSYSPSPLRSPSRSRSRSPHYRRRSPGQGTYNSLKRSKSPKDRYVNKYDRSSNKSPKNLRRSPRSRSPRRRDSPYQSYNNNGNRFKYERSQPSQQRYSSNNKNYNRRNDDDVKSNGSNTSKKDIQKVDATRDEKKENNAMQSENKTIVEAPKIIAEHPQQRPKTQEEIENDLLASSDEEVEARAAGDNIIVDGSVVDLLVNENDLLLFEDEESESENEGRFKSKPTTNNDVKYGKKSDFTTKALPLRSLSKERHYKHRDDNHRERNLRKDNYRSLKSDFSKDYKRTAPPRETEKPEPSKKAVPKKSPSPPEVVRSRKSSPKPVVHKKIETDPPKFKSTFKAVEATAEGKKNSSMQKSDRVSLNRSKLNTSKKEERSSSKASTPPIVKSTIIKAKDHSPPLPLKQSKSSVLNRLGGFVGGKVTTDKDKQESWLKKQVSIIDLLNNFFPETLSYSHRQISYGILC